MEKEQVYSLEVKQSDLESLVAVLDTCVKNNGISVAEKCSQLYLILLSAEPKVEAQPEEVKEDIVEEVSLDEVEDELQKIMEVPKKKRASKKKK
jgi:hypothetical protein